MNLAIPCPDHIRNVPARKRTREGYGHPRHDEAYQALDLDSRADLDDYRFTLQESFFNGIFWRMMGDEGARGAVYKKALLGPIVAAVLIGIYILGTSLPDVNAYISIAAALLRGIHPVVALMIGAIAGFVGVRSGWRDAFNDMMAACYIWDGGKRVIHFWYAASKMIGRADQFKTGQFLMTLPANDCCEDAPKCQCAPRMLYERYIETAPPSKITPIVTDAIENEQLLIEMELLGPEFPTVPPIEEESFTKNIPWIVIHIGILVAGFIIMSLEDPTP